MIEFVNVRKEYTLDKINRDSIKSLFSFNPMTTPRMDNKFLALDDVSFKIETGDCVGVLGGNGAGKSTILKLISKVTLPTEGEIKIEGRISSLLEVGAGFHMDLSGYDNIYLSGAILGLTNEMINSRLVSILAFADIGDFINEPVKHYSSGMILRLAFAIGISLESDILVIDEALSVGDNAFRAKCLKKIDEVINSGKTVVFVSHDTDQVKEICSSAIYMENGRLLHYGDVKRAIELYKNR